MVEESTKAQGYVSLRENVPDLDFDTIAKASQTLSGEVVLEKLLVRLVEIVEENSNAEKLILALYEESQDQYLIQAMSLSNGNTELMKGALLKENEDYAYSVFQYVLRSRESVVLGDAAASEEFGSDRYIKDSQTKSLLCTPIVSKQKTVGILYLENSNVYDVFTPDRLQVLNMVSSQAAISIDNALLYQSLEEKVQERTAELRQKTKDINNMFQYMHQGIFTMGEQLSIHHEYSHYLEDILETKSIANTGAMETLFVGCNLGIDDLDQIEIVLMTSFGTRDFMWDANSHLLIKEFQKTMPNGVIKILELEWDPMLNEDNEVEKVMVTVRDVTQLRQLQLEAETQKRELEIIGQILAISNEKFLNFIEGSLKFFNENQALIEGRQITAKRVVTIETLFRNMHTIKGNARTYGLNYITDSLHQAEHNYAKLRENPEMPWDPTLLLEDLDLCRKAMTQYTSLHEQRLETFAETQKEGVFIEDSLYQKMRLLAETEGSARMKTYFLTLETDSLQTILSDITEALPGLAETLKKESPAFVIEDNGIRFKKEIAPMLKDIFMHMIRNSIDHGLEMKEIRLSLGKPAAGTIQLTTTLVGNQVQFKVWDDGGGLAMSYLRHKAESYPIVVSSEADVANLIFYSGMSTAQTISDISGRGVGMDAVKKFLQDKGGDIVVQLTGEEVEGKQPFELQITLPQEIALQI